MIEARERLKREVHEIIFPRGLAKRFNKLDRFRIYSPICRTPENIGWSYDVEYEPEKYRKFVECIRVPSLVLDLGAHFGIYTLAAAARGARVIAFEPTPRSADYFLKNIHLNHLEHLVCLERVAVSDRVGEATLWVASSSAGNALQQSCLAASDPRPIQCHTTTLDTYCFERGLKPNLIKIDIEGAELRALTGMRQIISQHRPTLFIALHPGRIEAFGDSVRGVYELLASHGLRYEALSDTELLVSPLGGAS
jgi:FkbM family methyltransferase